MFEIALRFILDWSLWPTELSRYCFFMGDTSQSLNAAILYVNTYKH